MLESLTFCGRKFASDELELMRQMAAEFSALGVTEIARTVCELLEWKRPSGGLKNQECRQLLERLAAEGALKLPDLRKSYKRECQEKFFSARLRWRMLSCIQPPAPSNARALRLIVWDLAQQQRGFGFRFPAVSCL